MYGEHYLFRSEDLLDGVIRYLKEVVGALKGFLSVVPLITFFI